jgi:4-hydroxy-tetrahydrodipicolinate synthase
MNPLYNKLQGTGVALVTPFQKNGSIDFEAYIRLIKHILKGKCEYIVPLGSTGESVVLRRDEKLAIIDCTVEIVNGKVPIVLGLGGNNTAEILKSYDEFNFDGIDAILSVSPSYNKPSQQGIIQHYKAIAKAPVPVIIYNVPARTGSNITANTTLELAHSTKNLIGIKEASGDLNQAMMIMKDRPKDFLVLSGEDSLALPMIAAGAEGVVSVIGNAYPKECSDMVRLSLKGDFKKAQQKHYQLLGFNELIFKEGNPGGIKSALKAMGICDDHVRLPLVPVSKTLASSIHQFVKKFN